MPGSQTHQVAAQALKTAGHSVHMCVAKGR